ncbi:penicillin-binding protein 1C [Niveibacterium sp. 24ML]|uniref:penicillin-binding protein 1C n=1 Tax=Niveibacterium sp. 24ML TaxID=2985512 RepID=UPI002270F597|nr:penicillin-binding protein 1C [Niveibacterium sp. 24ML]MCX9158304.1 penicillin-binding protein 1C [Niveibacterium sp. 24ML]
MRLMPRLRSALQIRLRRRHVALACLAAVLLALLALDRVFPLPLPAGEAGLIVAAADGTPLRTWPSVDGVWRYPVRADQVSPRYLEAVLNYEDRWFRWHPGVNPFAMLRAAWQWLWNGRIVSGGSTLTMQVARMLDPPPRSVPGKLRQIARALQLEAHFSKDEILTLYLNHAPMGGIVEGVEMASRVYLGKPSKHLSHAEAALLAALPQAPSRLRPDRAPARAQAARDKVLERMAAFGVWSPALVADAKVERVGAQPIRAHWLAPLAAERLRSEARAPAGGPRTEGALQVVRSTLEPEVQSTLERMLLDRVDQLPPKVSMAALVMDNASLALLGYAGSADFSDRARFAHVDMVRGIRSPGSTLKPFLYAIALDEGLIHSESLLSDAPQAFAGYEPGNFQAAFSGPVSVADALTRSLNVPAVDLLDRVGPQRFAARLRAGGLRLRMAKGATPNLSLILGGAGTSLEELVGAYRALAAGGLAGQPRLSPDAPRIENRIMSEGAAFIVRDILETGGHPDRPFIESGARRVAWKTGTSFGFRDAWAVGVTDRHTIGVWIGRPDGTPNPGFFGANIAAPLLKDIVAALPGSVAATPRKPPASVSAVEICWPLGRALADTEAAHCHQQRSAWALNGAAPPTLPDRVRPGGQLDTVWIDPDSGLRSTPACRTDALPRRVARWPTHLEPFLGPALREKVGIPAWSPRCAQGGGDAGSLRITGITPGTVLRPTPGRSSARVSVQLLGASGKVWWLLDGRLLRSAPANIEQVVEVVSAGAHTLSVLDAGGRYAVVDFGMSIPGQP